MADEKNEVELDGKIVGVEKIKEGTKGDGTAWTLSQIKLMGSDDKVRKVSTFDTGAGKFTDKYVTILCEKQLNKKDGKTYTNYTAKKIEEQSGTSEPEPVTEEEVVGEEQPIDVEDIPPAESSPAQPAQEQKPTTAQSPEPQETTFQDAGVWDKKDRRIVRQNALTQANEFLKTMQNNGMITGLPKDDMEKILFNVAEKCENWVYRGL